jgi:cytochrome c553
MAMQSSALLRPGAIGLAVLGALALTLSTANSNGTAGAGAGRLLAGSGVPAPVRAILQRACHNCHSQETDWPWYAQIPPLSARIHEDVARGRAFMDLSQWNQYSEAQRRGFAAAIGAATASGLMPPPRYRWLHPEARLSSAELQTIQAWVLSASRKETANHAKSEPRP